MGRKTAFGQTWWGAAWVRAMERLDRDANRLPRGRAYARDGSVRTIDIREDGTISARVQGSRRSPYRMAIRLHHFTAAEVEGVKDAIATDPSLAAELSLGTLPSRMLDLLHERGIYLFPQIWSELAASCSCPDWANPCKHLAAVYYLVADEIDKDPFLLFSLRGLSAPELMGASGLRHNVRTADPFVPLDRARTVPPAFPPTEKGLAGLYAGMSQLTSDGRHDHKALFALLDARPLFYPGGDFKQMLLRAYRHVSASIAGNAPQDGEVDLRGLKGLCVDPGTVDILTGATAVLSSNSRAAALFPGTDRMVHLPEDPDGQWAMVRRKCHAVSSSVLVESLMQIRLDLSPERNSEAGVFIRAAVSAAQAMAQASAFIPVVCLHDGNGGIVVRYRPLAGVPGVETTMECLRSLIPAAFVFRPSDHTALTERDGVEAVLSALLSYIAFRYSREMPGGRLGDSFFRGVPYVADGFSDTHTIKAVSDWLAVLHSSQASIGPVLRLEPGENSGDLVFEIDVENRAEPMLAPVPLREVFGSGRRRILSLPVATVRSEVARQLTLAARHCGPLRTALSGGGAPITLDPLAAAEFLRQGHMVCRLLGARVVIPRDLATVAAPRLSIKANLRGTGRGQPGLDGLLSFSWEVAVGDHTLTAGEFRRLVDRAAGVVTFRDRYLLLDPKQVAAILERLDQPIGDIPTMQAVRGAVTGELGDVGFSAGEALERLIRRLGDPAPVEPPAGLTAALRPYQLRGYRWLHGLTGVGLGACLADDMGLGKTVQVIALLLGLKEEGRLTAPALVVCPTTLVGHWARECARFAPDLKVSAFHGSGRRVTAGDLIITSYGVLRRDIARFSRTRWSLVVADEAQNIKNPDTDQARAAGSLSAAMRVALSGTPVENRLSELWGIFNFINPGYLGTRTEFGRRFEMPIEKYRDGRRIEQLRKIIGPFILRRLKTDRNVIGDLPEKIVRNEYCHLTAEQAALYQAVVDRALEEIANSEGIARRGLVFKLITSLKQICNHPAHYGGGNAALSRHSGKSSRALPLIDGILTAGERALVFTQYRKMGALLVGMIEEELGADVVFFHGGLTRDRRDRMVRDFQEGVSGRLMVISLKAGGTGLNLVAATNVIHYDLWWNPAVESQATDRAHRIGQRRKVVVHRLVTLGTFEEKINDMIGHKRELADLTITAGEQWLTELPVSELREIFRLGSGGVALEEL